MDVTQLIEKDHTELKALIEKVKEAPDGQRNQAFKNFLEALTIHHEAEERAFFETIVTNEALAHDGLHAVKEHGEHAVLIDRAKSFDCLSDNWEEAFGELAHEVVHHLEEEEEDVLPKVREHFSDSERTDMGQTMQRVKGGLASAA